jgi:hypothetical protein
VTEPGRAPVSGDVLVAGDDEPPWSLGRRRTRQLSAVLIALAVLAGGVELVTRNRAADQRARAEAAAADALEIALGDNSKLPRDGPQRHGVFVEIINFGPRDVQVLSIEVGPDPDWAVLPDQAGLLRARSSVVLELRVPCAEDDPVGEGVGRAPVPDPQTEPPRTVRLTAELASGRTASTELDLVEAPLADGGDLDPLLRGGPPDLSMPDLSTPDFTASCA